MNNEQLAFDEAAKLNRNATEIRFAIDENGEYEICGYCGISLMENEFFAAGSICPRCWDDLEAKDSPEPTSPGSSLG